MPFVNFGIFLVELKYMLTVNTFNTELLENSKYPSSKHIINWIVHALFSKY